ncbi:Gfo/Idh/MocA family oxidoreductase [Salinivibrio proteolyticus]|uniref:Gfo/Idh/MocA family oxidoreductase n=1 Tax=Salinivibrio proteolyticus TaxID=334715 RepID=A0ABY7LKN6_9GAMM|nr:Gfo/Idh/MocA family oxidoreductase [Salinivibrio proteolyticus]WBA16238.1 Gfo/Idh/MocA family oxidoreductase [Salinivibrio proteolyticus]
MIKTALVGFGFSANTFHLPFLNAMSQFDITAVVSSKPENVRLHLPQATCYADLNTLLEHESPDLVVITTPNHLHYEHARQSLEAGCHVLVEKPFVTRSEDGLALAKLADEKGLTLCPYHNRRWDGDFLTLQSLIENDELGDIKVMHSSINRYRPEVRQRWRELPGEGAGILFDLGSHLIDQALTLLGDPNAISAQCRALRPGCQTTDYFQLTLHYPDSEVILNSSPYRSGTTERFTVHGEKATFSCDGLDIQEDQLRAAMSILDKNFGTQSHQATLEKGDSVTKMTCPLHTGQYQQLFTLLAESITHQRPSPVSAESATKVIYAIELAQRASETGSRQTWQYSL